MPTQAPPEVDVLEGRTTAIADHAIDLGPGAGSAGGEVVFEGIVAALKISDILTARHLSDRASLKRKVRKTKGVMEICGANRYNLKQVEVDISLNVLSTALSRAVRGGVTIDQTPIRGSRRCNPVTNTGLLESVRKAFAKADGVNAALFSVNSKRACPMCNRAGLIYTDLGPGAGQDSGRVVFQGTPAALVATSNMLTDEHLAAFVR